MDRLTRQRHRHHTRVRTRALLLATTPTLSLRRLQEHHLLVKLTGISHTAANPTLIARRLLPARTADRTTNMGHNNTGHNNTEPVATRPSNQPMALLLTSKATELPRLVGINQLMAHREASTNQPMALLREDSTSKTTVQRRQVVIRSTLLRQASSHPSSLHPRDISNRSLRRPDSSSSSSNSIPHPLDNTSNILRRPEDPAAATTRRMVPQAVSPPMASSLTSRALLQCPMVAIQAKEDMVVTKGSPLLRRIFALGRRRMHEFLCVCSLNTDFQRKMIIFRD